MNYLIYDCEIVKCIPPKDTHLDPNYDYCEGWHDHANMGISVIATYWSYHDCMNFLVGDPHVSCEAIANLKLLEERAKVADAVVGFNSRNFDDRLLAANNITIRTDYDILEQVRIAAGFEANYQSVPKGFSYSLDAIAKANGMAKTGTGALAPQLWQQGRHQEVIEYCLNDVRITHKILKLGLTGYLKDPNTGETLKLKSL